MKIIEDVHVNYVAAALEDMKAAAAAMGRQCAEMGFDHCRVEVKVKQILDCESE